ncbi:hypothetical protein RDV89_06210 [Nocardioides zeae]|uniref:Uncharacterized protein n=1 Tax=Nocardioides imazamoxiresistens TaxID=3231893 RepID=A0ABU3PV63_9ACTN|nr:hypothetical protein [Nocardioides zeae]MDT9592650.1 hypothetical protein [Nocardioides zeae]
MSLVGHQAYLDEGGGRAEGAERALTLAPLWPRRPRAVVVGLRPVPCSVEAGHYFHGPVGRRQLGRLAGTGLFAPPAAGGHLDDAAVAGDVGLVNLVLRPGSGAPGPDELADGRERVVAEVTSRRVGLVVCLTRQPAIALLGRSERPGFQPGTLPGGAEVFRMPGPFAAAADVAPVLTELRAWLDAEQPSPPDQLAQ